MITADELVQAEKHGLSEEEIERQIKLIREGVQNPELIKAAKINDGIIAFDETEQEKFIKLWENESGNVNAMKFVPASGAASRMFKSLNFIYHNYDSITLKEISKKAKTDAEFAKAELFFGKIKRFPFADEIPDELKNFGENDDLFPLIDFIMRSDGLGFGDIPKGLIKFHKYGGKDLTPIEEQVEEASEILRGQTTKCLHFTISPRFEERFRKHFEEISKNASEEIRFEYSFQHPSTDTIVWDGEKLLRNKNGEVVFRPGGHGALIKNLNELDADFIFIKNIDNVSKREIASETVRYKKLLGGYALYLSKKTDEILRGIEQKQISDAALREALDFAEKTLNIDISDLRNLSGDEARKKLFAKLNKPLRVAGMVKNTGEPGGGPFWVKNEDGTMNLQIVEKAQINTSDENQKTILNSSTHFNPVDLVCRVKNYKGEKFDLTEFVNERYGIITEKHLEGKDVKVLELPGLWNAAMWDWITVFVDVPLETFTPVKEVTDLLKKEHN